MSARFWHSVAPPVPLLLVCLSCSSHGPVPAYDVAPVLANREEITAALHAVGAGLEARVVLLVRVDDHGYVQEVRLARGSGDGDLDRAALWIGEQMRFRPARYKGEPVPALVEVPVVFDVVRSVVRPPRLRNAEEVAGIMIRDHGDLRGTVRFRIRVGPEGWVRVVREGRTSTPEVMSVARRLIDEVRFWPAIRGGTETADWVNLTFEFAGAESRVYIEDSGR